MLGKKGVAEALRLEAKRLSRLKEGPEIPYNLRSEPFPDKVEERLAIFVVYSNLIHCCFIEYGFVH